MLDSRQSFERAILNFPKWMDIRKRKKTSYGGRYLQSIVKELDDIQAAINDYKKDFFIVNYIGREDTVIDYLYVANVGEVEEENFILISPLNKATFDVKEFYSSDAPIALYHDGRLLFKVDDVLQNDVVKYSRNGFAYTATLTKVHIWNVIDEFAMYAGIKRHKDETNKELLERTLLVFKNRTNSTEEGLKNAIRNVVSNYVHLSLDEIKIEKPDDKNLFKADENDEVIIERLAQLNKDTFRTKKWDESRWEHPFKKLEYIPPKWDEELKDIQDGVGHNDSLKASLLSELENSESSDVRIDLYEKSDVRINEYIRNQRVEVDLDLQLKKYQNILKPKTVEYKIIAEETTDLTDENVYIECHRISEGEKEHYVADLILNPNDVKDITVERGKLKPNTKYKLQFKPKTEYGQMEITKARLVNNSTETSLLEEKGAYKFKDGVLVNSNVSLHANSTHHFKDYKNIRNLKPGFTLADATQDGVAVIDVTNMEHQYVKVEVESKETSIIRDREFVKPDDSFVVNDANQLVSTAREGDIVIELSCNQLYFEMESGNCIVTKIIDGEHFPSEIWYEAKSEHLKFDKTKDVKIIIRKLNNDKQLVISDIRYARYDVEIKLQYGSFINTPLGSVIPKTDEEENAIVLTFRTYSGYSPEIKFVHIGSSLKNAVYETSVFKTGADNNYIDFDTNCEVSLIELDNTGNVVSKRDSFICKDLYKNTRSTPVYLQIDTSGFASIRKTIPAIDRFSYQGKMSDWIRLDPGQEIDTVLIDGNVRTTFDRVFINDLLRKGPYDRIYASRKLKGFVVQSGNSEKLVKLTREDIGMAADAYTVHNLPYGARGAFVVDSSNNVESISTSHSQAFQYFYVFPSNTQEHVAYNRVNMLRPEVADVEIVDMFSPIIPPNKLMIYVIEPVVKENLKASVEFIKNSEHEKWSLGKKRIRVQMEVDQGLSDNYDLKEISIKQKFILSNNINLDEQITINGESFNIGEFIVIPPEGMRVVYENRTSQPEVFYAEEDGFNKLKYSNMVSVVTIQKANGQTVPASDYELLKAEGIIAWKNKDLIGEEITIVYRYGVPRYITFTNLEKLYELVGYDVEAYRFLSSLYYRNISEDTILQDGDFEKVKNSDRVIASSSNPNFRVRIDNDIIRLTRVNEEDYVAVKTGFFYQDGQELYHFANRNEDLLERMSNVELVNTERLAGYLKLNHQSKNFLPDTSMKPKRKEILSIVDFVNNERINGLSRLEMLTACDNYNNWSSFEMNISFAPGLNGLGMKFEQLSKHGYALMDITKYINGNTIISLYAEGKPEVLIAKERKHQRHSFNKSIFAEPFGHFKNHEEFMYFIFNEENFDSGSKYYLVVKSNGVVDDIVIKDYVPEESIRSIHTKNIASLGLSIEEKATQNYIQKLMFDKDGNRLERLEIAEDGTVRTGVNVDWGFTKIQEFKSNWRDCVLKEVDLVKDSFIQSGSRFGSIETDAIYVRNKKSLRSMIVKVNEMLLESTTDFRIEVCTSDRPDGRYNLIAVEEEGNTLIVPYNRLSNYIKVKVEMPPNKVINNLEVYSEYVETDSPLRIGEYENGQLITKVYDTGFTRHYKIKQFIADEATEPERISISVRAFRYEDNRLVWTDWKPLNTNQNLEVTNNIEFEDYRYFQFMIALRSTNATIRLNNIELEVIR